MKKFTKSPLATAMGTLVLSGFAANVSADLSPFAISELSSGYMQVAADTGNKVNEGGCGAKNGANSPAKTSEGSCGEGKCGAMMSGGKMKPGMEHSCGAMMKSKEGSCGMGGMNHADDSKKDKTSQGSCGAMMHGGKEGSCGAKVDADKAAGK